MLNHEVLVEYLLAAYLLTKFDNSARKALSNLHFFNSVSGYARLGAISVLLIGRTGTLSIVRHVVFFVFLLHEFIIVVNVGNLKAIIQIIKYCFVKC